jgi:hypothetical protein
MKTMRSDQATFQPSGLDFAQRIHALRSEKEKRALRQLVTLERIEQVNGICQALPTHRNEKWRQEWQPDPY